MLGERVGVLLVGAGAAWEVPALQRLGADPRLVVLKRCVDLHDLLASAATGQAHVAVVDAGTSGLDVDSVERLRRCGVSAVAVGAGREAMEAGTARSMGIRALLDGGELDDLAEAVVRAAGDAERPAARAADPGPGQTSGDGADADGEDLGARPDGRLVAVWGPTGAPGRTTVAVGLAAELARRGQDTFLLDLDGYGGAVAQHLGVLDEVSGLLSAARLANAGRLDRERLAAAAREVGPHLRVLTGLPRADRWVEVREAALGSLLDLAPSLCSTAVLDVGFGLEQDSLGYGAAPGRNHMTVTALERADEVVVVGSADPVGLARLARGLVELLEVVPGGSLRVVVNRMRSTLGWSPQEVRTMIEGFVTPSSIHVLPLDQAAADRALVAGRPVGELGDSALSAAIATLADALADTLVDTPAGSTQGARRRRLSRRTAGTAR